MALETFGGHAGSSVIFEPGDLLVQQGREADRIYHIHYGTVDILQHGIKVMSTGTDTVLGVEPLFFPGENYLYSARAASQVRGVEYTYPGLLDLLADQSGLTGKLLFSLSFQLRRLWQDRQASGPADKNELHYSGEVRCYFKDQWVIREGEDSQEIFRIVSTENGLEVSREGQVLAHLNACGEFFGEMAPLLGEKRTAGVKSLGTTVLEVYQGADLERIITDYPDVALRIIRAQTRRLAETSARLASSQGR